jgi:hypothetical protein
LPPPHANLTELYKSSRAVRSISLIRYAFVPTTLRLEFEYYECMR